MAKAKIEFLWYKAGDEIGEVDKEHIPLWASQGFVVVDEGQVDDVVKAESQSVADKVKDVVDDLLDDGKLNNSNKKFRGRPPKARK
jgi:5,10-methenyltetrahydromethanopterin hydrogenase